MLGLFRHWWECRLIGGKVFLSQSLPKAGKSKQLKSSIFNSLTNAVWFESAGEKKLVVVNVKPFESQFHFGKQAIVDRIRGDEQGGSSQTAIEQYERGFCFCKHSNRRRRRRRCSDPICILYPRHLSTDTSLARSAAAAASTTAATFSQSASQTTKQHFS